jgi:hypothetical protein
MFHRGCNASKLWDCNSIDLILHLVRCGFLRSEMSENMKGGDSFENVDVHGSIIVKLTLNK